MSLITIMSPSINSESWNESGVILPATVVIGVIVACQSIHSLNERSSSVQSATGATIVRSTPSTLKKSPPSAILK